MNTAHVCVYKSAAAALAAAALAAAALVAAALAAAYNLFYSMCKSEAAYDLFYSMCKSEAEGIRCLNCWRSLVCRELMLSCLARWRLCGCSPLLLLIIRGTASCITSNLTEQAAPSLSSSWALRHRIMMMHSICASCFAAAGSHQHDIPVYRSRCPLTG